MRRRDTRGDYPEDVTAALERLRLREYLEFRASKPRVLLTHLVFGVLRGMGFALGFSILSAGVVVLLRHLMVENIPLIGGFLAELIAAIQQRL